MPKEILQVKNVSYAYGSKRILHNLYFSVKQGNIVTIIGESGSGKTTLFKLLTGLLDLQEGIIEIASENDEGHSQISYMVQEDLLLSWRTISQNLMLINELGSSKKDPHFFKNEALQLLHEVGLENCADLYPEQLSGGMRQRVSLVRAILQKRPICLLDEPFQSLDVGYREKMYMLLCIFQKKYNITILMITHDFHDAIYLSNQIHFLSEGCIKKSWEIDPQLRNDPYFHQSLLNEMREAFIPKTGMLSLS